MKSYSVDIIVTMNNIQAKTEIEAKKIAKKLMNEEGHLWGQFAHSPKVLRKSTEDLN